MMAITMLFLKVYAAHSKHEKLTNADKKQIRKDKGDTSTVQALRRADAENVGSHHHVYLGNTERSAKKSEERLRVKLPSK